VTLGATGVLRYARRAEGLTASAAPFQPGGLISFGAGGAYHHLVRRAYGFASPAEIIEGVRQLCDAFREVA
jgi:hypothetical protein